MNDIKYMSQAHRLALRGKNTASPNPMVGAVIVKGGKVIAEGFHHHPGGPHAEIVALNKVKGSLQGAKMYVTLEPCHHFGRTPPCVDAVIKSGVREVIVGMSDPNPKTNGKSIFKLRKAGIKVSVGILQDELEQMNESFVKYIKLQMPFVVAKSAQTLDGKIATSTGQSQWITSKLARDYSHVLRNEFDAILVGINTVLKDNPGLNAAAKTKHLKKIIVDSSLRIPLKAKLFNKTRPVDCFIATTKTASKNKISILEKSGVNVIVCPNKDGQVDLKWLMKELARHEIAKVLIEGGGRVIGSALKANLVDKMLIFIAPKILGDDKARSSVTGLNPRHVDQGIRLRNITIKAMGDDFLFEGYIIKKG